jgi:hypothetical protein
MWVSWSLFRRTLGKRLAPAIYIRQEFRMRHPYWACTLTVLLVFVQGTVFAADKTAPSKKKDAVTVTTDPRLSVDDLGFTAEESKSDPEMQAKLEKRSHRLKAHQVMGLLTAIPMVGNVILSNGVDESRSKRNLHAAVGIFTTAMYATTAYLALTAPKIPGVKKKGSTRIHRWLAVIHGSMMLATPILGEMAKHQLDTGSRRVHGIASLHSAAVTTLLISYGAAMGVMVINF